MSSEQMIYIIQAIRTINDRRCCRCKVVPLKNLNIRQKKSGFRLQRTEVAILYLPQATHVA
ncbi:MAG: hypothetical protein EPGJADBJ_00841 [Saprospiraceae bacterium]|nr:hypothetical protein [Saprospiraceae bacterium]